MKITMLGTGAALPDPDRGQSSILVTLDNGAHYLLDCGHGATRQMVRANVNPADSKLADPEERARMMRVFDQGLNTPKGYVLPIQRSNAGMPGRWRSERWKLRRGNIFLTPGDSPLGLRLPLSSLPWVLPKDTVEHEHDPDPFESRGALATRGAGAPLHP